MKIIFDEFANNEYNDAVEYYELQIPGLGKRFTKEIKRVLRTIKKYPRSGVIEKNDIRRFTLNKFPYIIYYTLEEDFILISAIVHTHREPQYWSKRKKQT